MMRRALLPLTLALGLLVPTAATTVAFTGIDQRQEDTSIVVSSSGSGNQIAQSFTAGLDGTLVAIALHTDLSLDGTQLQIQEAWGSLPTDTVLSTTTIDSSATGWVKYPVSPVTIEAGSGYAIVLSFGAGHLAGKAGATYPGGVVSVKFYDWTPIPSELAFRTYVRTSSDPAFTWVKAPTRPRGGSTATYRFSLGGDFGLDVLRGGSPTTTRVSCSTGERIKGTTFRTRPFGGAISYDGGNDTYSISWKVRPEWARGALACRQLEVWIRGEAEPHTVTVKVRPPEPN
jgi:hypothetical protein